jgi:hypothetical protein
MEIETDDFMCLRDDSKIIASASSEPTAGGK